MKNVLVTGATGFIGFEVSRQLIHQGYRPRLMVRRPIRGMILNGLDADLMQGDLGRPESLKRLIAGVDTVIHLGAMATFEPYTKVRPSIVEGSMNLMKAAIEEGVESFVFGGSLLVYDSQVGEIGQDTPARPRTGYGRAKLEAETRMVAMTNQGIINFCSLRLPHVYGAKSLLFHRIRQGRVIFPGRGDNLFAHLHVFDAARALIQAAKSGTKGIYVVADNLSCTWNEFFETTQSFYPKLIVIHIPKWLAMMTTSLVDLLARFKKTPNKYTAGAVTSWNLNLPVAKDTLQTLLGLEPEYPSVVNGIPEVLDDCVCFGWCPSNMDY